jgi:hypothetical protein
MIQIALSKAASESGRQIFRQQIDETCAVLCPCFAALLEEDDLPANVPINGGHNCIQRPCGLLPSGVDHACNAIHKVAVIAWHGWTRFGGGLSLHSINHI